MRGQYNYPPLRSGGGVSAKPAGLVSLTEGATCFRRNAPSVTDFALTGERRATSPAAQGRIR
jgi:hypothetical protein